VADLAVECELPVDPAGRWRRGASEDVIAGVLLAIAPVAGLGRVVAAAPEVAIALGYDIEAALEEPNGC
jgi:hypothetical protein